MLFLGIVCISADTNIGIFKGGFQKKKAFLVKRMGFFFAAKHLSEGFLILPFDL
jgi:hypothetical protein